MEVKLIDYTGNGNPIPDFAARLLAYTKNTRLEQGEETFAKFMNMPMEELAPELDYISKTLRSSWEFIDFTFQVKGVTRAFTHQLVRTRTASYAQQAQRVVDLSDAAVEKPTTIEADSEASKIWDDVVKSIFDGYSALRSRDIPTQDARGLIPTNIHTNIMVKINLRTFADLVGKRQNLRAQGEYSEVVALMAKEVLGVMPWAKPFLYPDRLATPALDALLKEALGNRGPVEMPRINEALKELDTLKAIWG